MHSPLLALLLAASTQTASEAIVEERDDAAIYKAMQADAKANTGADFADAETSTDTEETAKAEEKAEPDHPEARLYDATIDASAAVDAALARANARKVNVLIVLGANWCHDSRAFAGWSETARIGDMIAERFELVFVNVGMPQTKDGHNAHIMRRFGFDKQEATPMVIVATPAGTVLNRETAQGWSNTASRSEDEIYDELVMLAKTLRVKRND